MTSIIKVDNLQNQCGANIISESANVITIGASGDTVTLAAGASQSGFGRSGSVNWDTTKKTTGFTAVSGNGYFCDTTSAAFTVTLPATPTAGDIVAIADYNGTAITNNITVGRNSSNINGSATNLTINANYSAVTLVYVDATSGWRSVDSSNPNDIVALPEYVEATGGTITTCGNFKIHTFTGPGTFTVSSAGNSLGSSSVDYLVVAGGGGSGTGIGGGGGAGGYRTSFPGGTKITVGVGSIPITVGAGGAGAPYSPQIGTAGNDSIFSSITSAGGGFGAITGGGPGGSGGGNGYALTPQTPIGGTGNTPPVSPPQGNPGGIGNNGPSIYTAGGGGGSTSAGSNGGVPGPAGAGGSGTANSISGSPVTYAGGGGGSGSINNNQAGGAAGPGGGGRGETASPYVVSTEGTANTGGGGGGSSNDSGRQTPGRAGGSGIVVIRYRFQ